MSHPHQSQRSHRNRGQQTANSVSTTEETISLPSIITARVMPSKRQEFGWVGSVKTIGPHHGRLVLFPNEGVNMNILPSGVVFLCENDLTSHPIKGRDGYILTGTPIGNRSFGSDEDIKKAQEIKKIEINDYLAKKALHAQAIQVMEGIELPFVRKGKRHLEELCQLAIQGSNIEALQSLMMLVTEVKNLTIPTGVVIGGSYSGVGGRHECVVMNASNELIVMAVAVAVSKGWWAFAAMQDPDKTQWAVAMTTTEQAVFDWDPQDELVRLKEGKKPAAPDV
jgi:hypothetical protein